MLLCAGAPNITKQIPQKHKMQFKYWSQSQMLPLKNAGSCIHPDYLKVLAGDTQCSRQVIIEFISDPRSIDSILVSIPGIYTTNPSILQDASLPHKVTHSLDPRELYINIFFWLTGSILAYLLLYLTFSCEKIIHSLSYWWYYISVQRIFSQHTLSVSLILLLGFWKASFGILMYFLLETESVCSKKCAELICNMPIKALICNRFLFSYR